MKLVSSRKSSEKNVSVSIVKRSLISPKLKLATGSVQDHPLQPPQEETIGVHPVAETHVGGRRNVNKPTRSQLQQPVSPRFDLRRQRHRRERLPVNRHEPCLGMSFDQLQLDRRHLAIHPEMMTDRRIMNICPDLVIQAPTSPT